MEIRQKLDNQNKTENESKENESVIERLKALLSVSKRIKVDMIQELLKLNKETLIKVLIEWGQKYNFELDGDYLNINKELLPKLIKWNILLFFSHFSYLLLSNRSIMI